jgi:16S rRNA (guanine527-N7)-methyltransferase
VTVNDRQRKQLEVYLNNLLLWNQRLALVSQKDPAPIVEKHFADAIVAAHYCRGASTVVDLGSGAGFPGIVIGIHCPATRVALIESRRKKVSFLLDTIRAVGLVNVDVVADRIESASCQREHATRYDISIARALGSVSQLLEHSRLLLKDAGQAIAMKGPSYEAEVEKAPLERLGFGPPTFHAYTLPDQSQRVLLSFTRRRAAGECFT